ncbi:MAG: DNA-binding protein [Erysipelotrichales bacterium]|nr:DNA-binding protein [Erysipelotrichales bacterium]
MLDDFDRINRLLDQYKSLLTDKQIEAMELHYSSDLSYKEIAEECGISKAAAYDLICRTEKTLEHYEECLHLAELSDKRNAVIEEMLQSNDQKCTLWGEKLRKLEERED